MEKIIVTTSWDDGYILDLRLARLLQKYGLAGTFYIAPDDTELPDEARLTPEQIKSLGEHFEIGAHTITHPRLPMIDDGKAEQEISGSKASLEAVIGKPIKSFCYPGGLFENRHLQMVSNAGMKLARTTERFQFNYADPLKMPTTIHAYRHWSDIWAILKFASYNPVKTVKYLLNWDELAIALFDFCAQNGGIYHLWGHSWEIENHYDWQRLENVLRYISGHSGVRYSTNGELV